MKTIDRYPMTPSLRVVCRSVSLSGLVLLAGSMCLVAGRRVEAQSVDVAAESSSRVADGVSVGLPEEPLAQNGGQTTGSVPAPRPPDEPNKRILGIIPNYRSVGIDAKLPPQSPREKLKTAMQDTFDIGAFELAAAVSLEQYVTNQTPEFNRGFVGYGRYYWHAFADQGVENASVEFIVPALTHEDTRYYTLGRGTFGKRAGYALTRIFVGRTDSGKKTINLGEVLGAGMAAGVSSLYYPSRERTAGKVLEQYALDLGIDDASFFIREFDHELSGMFKRHPHAQTNP